MAQHEDDTTSWSWSEIFGSSEADKEFRDPCPHRIISDLGGAFGMGCIGGAIWHFVRGAKNSPKGERLRGSFTAMRVRAPQIGGSFAAWGGLYSSFDCMMVGLRGGKEDPINSIVSGFLTGCVLAAKGGIKRSLASGVVGGLLLGLIEAVAWAFTKYGERWGASLLGIEPPRALIPPVQLRSDAVEIEIVEAESEKQPRKESRGLREVIEEERAPSKGRPVKIIQKETPITEEDLQWPAPTKKSNE